MIPPRFLISVDAVAPTFTVLPMRGATQTGPGAGNTARSYRSSDAVIRPATWTNATESHSLSRKVALALERGLALCTSRCQGCEDDGQGRRSRRRWLDAWQADTAQGPVGVGGHHLGGIHRPEPAGHAPPAWVADSPVPDHLGHLDRGLRLSPVAAWINDPDGLAGDASNWRPHRLPGAPREAGRGLSGRSPAARDLVRRHGVAFTQTYFRHGRDAASLRT